MYKHPTFEKKTPFFPYCLKSALFTELITLTLCTSSGKPKTLGETHLLLARRFPFEAEREELAQVRNPCCLPQSPNTGILRVACSLWAKSITSAWPSDTTLQEINTKANTTPGGTFPPPPPWYLRHAQVCASCPTPRALPGDQVCCAQERGVPPQIWWAGSMLEGF